jgi:molybdopterin molybdotransferase
MAGHARCFRRPLRGRLSEAVWTRPEKAYYLRVRIEPDLESKPDRVGWLVTPVGAQGSAILTGLAAADGLAVVPLGVGDLPAGAEVDVLPLDGWAAESDTP